MNTQRDSHLEQIKTSRVMTRLSFVEWGWIISVLLFGWGCEEPCSAGAPCEDTCMIGLAPVCVAAGICECVPISTIDANMNPEGGTSTLPNPANGPACAAPNFGELVLNEVMINPSGPEPQEEYIELINLSAQEVNLLGVTLTYRGDEKLRFTAGCMAPNSAVALYDDELLWRWSSPSREVAYTKGSFRFANTSDFAFELYSATGDALSSMIGEASLIKEGKSINRTPDINGESLALHPEVSPASLLSSPAACANGGTFELACTDGMMGSQLPPPGGTEVDMMGGMGGTETPIGGTSGGGEVIPPPNCDPPFIGDLVINEVLSNPEGTEQETKDEFIEILNRSEQPVNLQDISLKYLKDETEEQSGLISFTPGCFPAKSALAIYHQTPGDRWVWSSIGQDTARLSQGHSTFMITNSKKVTIQLLAQSGQILSQMSFPSSVAETSGVSANRSPDGVQEAEVSLHTELSSTSSISPGSCPNGGRYEENCVGQQ